MRMFTLYIVNNKNGRYRDVQIYAASAYQARKLASESILKPTEIIMSVFPYIFV